ncbi:M20/M25/M40 family metallo-hydrolase [Streptomyces lavendulocolor]|uniref:M20/M25/M40 family metallo-hydrolase n=1 Tax=Streptomyces lavendulocolor TaxID=67316 RepID=UPI003C30B4EB
MDSTAADGEFFDADSEPRAYDPAADPAPPGADDDGSGTAGVMAAAECLRRLLDDGGTPTRNIRFVLFNAEEQALTGSKFSARAAAAAGDRIAGVFQMDMIAGRQRASASTVEIHSRLVGRRAGRHRVRRPGPPGGAYRTADRPGGDGPAGHRRRRPGGGAQRPRRLPRAGVGGRGRVRGPVLHPRRRARERHPAVPPPATPSTTRTTAPTSPPPSHGPSPRPPSRSRACEGPAPAVGMRTAARAASRLLPTGAGSAGVPPETLPHGAFRRCGPSETGTRDDRSGVRLRGAARRGGGHARRRGRPAPP